MTCNANMYLKSIKLQNTGPISDLVIEMPFASEFPKPLVLVGPNGSGKSTVLSFIVNALTAMKQKVFDDSELEKGRAYRIRSPLNIRGDANFYHADIEFKDGMRLNEWQLDRPKAVFETELGRTPDDPTWQKIPQQETSHFDLTFGTLSENHELEKAFNTNCTLFFPADRFEPPDWLNTEDLSRELKLPEPSRIKGRTARRIFARNRLKPTMDWMTSILLDMLLHEHQVTNFPVQPVGSAQSFNLPVRVAVPGPTTAAFNALVAVLKEMFAEAPSDQLQVSLGDRRSRVLSASVLRNGVVVRTIKDLLSLSAGESALFCLFATIILDADLAGTNFKTTNDIRGIVLIDEIDLHLHLGLQNKVLPKLIALFPRIQFLFTVHSPLVVLGMESKFGQDGFSVLDMPNGTPINPESYSEFLHAFKILSATRKFESQVVTRVNTQPKPVILVEGVSDSILLRNAWEKLYPSDANPYEIIPCGIEPTLEARSGGAEMLRRCLEFLAIASDRRILAMFDNDRVGNEQFMGVSKKGFTITADSSHKQHKVKPVHAILLPVPVGRETFVTASDAGQRYLSIEHYFNDAILISEGMKGSSILGTSVFEITGDKVGFANKSSSFSQSEFDSFTVLFARLASLLS